MANSKRKGTAAERELANIFTAAGVPSRRSVQYCGRAGDADIVCDHLDLHIEVKRTEQLRLTEVIAQASSDSGGKPWIIVHRSNGRPWMVIQTFDQWAADSAAFRAARAKNAAAPQEATDAPAT
jgi:Holliday junction resolvase